MDGELLPILDLSPGLDRTLAIEGAWLVSHSGEQARVVAVDRCRHMDNRMEQRIHGD